MKTRFRDSFNKLLSIIKIIRYTIKNVRIKKNSIDYIINIFIHSKNIELTIIETIQILLIYKHINIKFRRDLFKFTNIFIITNFINNLRI